MITSSQIFDYLQCPHRLHLDATSSESLRDPTSAFTEMLWQQGLEHTESTLATLGITADMRAVPEEQRETATLDAMNRREALIYRGRVCAEGLLAEPDLLELQPDGTYAPGDIKFGSGFEGEDDDSAGRPKLHYAAPLAHHSHILERRGLSTGRHMAFVVDNEGNRVPYDLDASRGSRNTQSWFDFYLDTLHSTQALLSGRTSSRPALSAPCKLCHWASTCKKAVIAANDLSLIPELGRSKRDVLTRLIPDVRTLATCNVANYMAGKKTVFPGIGPETLEKYQARARLLCDPSARPYLKSPIDLPVRKREIFFDIEADPFKGNFVYLHGFVERDHGRVDTACFHPFFANGATPADEEAVFAGAWNYLTERVMDSVIYYYSQYEPTSYKRLARRFPSVCSVEDVEALFARPEMIDLYAVVRKHTEWPCNNLSIKTLAVYCGFHWRDESPSGAASIEWYRRWIETGDPAIKHRICAYNEDDNIATSFIVDEIRRMECPVRLAA